MISTLVIALALGQAPTPTPPPVVPQAVIVVPSRSPIVLYSGATSKSPVQWILISPKDAKTKVYGDALIIPDPVPGQVYKVAQVATGDTPATSFDFAEVQAPGVPAPVPAPTPTPQPTPAPSPTPDAEVKPVVTGHIAVTMFHDVNDQNVTPFRIDPNLRKSLKDLDADWYLLATNSPAAAPFLGEIAFAGTPLIVVQDAQNRLIKDRDNKTLTYNNVNTPAELLHEIRALRGK